MFLTYGPEHCVQWSIQMVYLVCGNDQHEITGAQPSFFHGGSSQATHLNKEQAGPSLLLSSITWLAHKQSKQYDKKREKERQAHTGKGIQKRILCLILS